MWLCPSCGLNNVNANRSCANFRCKHARSIGDSNRSIDIVEPDDFDILSRQLDYHYLGITKMTPQEELFAEFFQKHAMLVKDMDLLELRAYREKLSLIAREAKAGIYASDEKEKDLVKKARGDKPSGFSRSVNVDEVSSEAINAVKERQKRMTKMEKIQAGLEKLGISTTDASKLMSAGTILGRVKADAATKNGEEKKEVKPLINPFEKK